MLIVLVIFSRSCTSSSPAPDIADRDTNLVTQLSQVCYLSWQQYNWTIGEQGMLARDNTAFRTGIQRICQARAELFFEGYEVSPFIAADSQHKIFPIVFIPSVSEIKSVIRQNVPPLRII